jgi:hypothetical protein
LGTGLLTPTPDLGAGEGLRRRAVVLRHDVGIRAGADAVVQQRVEEPDRLLALRAPR